MTSVTIDRLHNLTPGETIVFYRGNIADDVVRSEGEYRALLNGVQVTVRDLEQLGRIRVDMHTVEREKSDCKGKKAGKWTEFVYEATGL